MVVVNVETRETAFKQALQLIDFSVPPSKTLNLEQHLELLRESITLVIKKLLRQHTNVKVWIVQEVDFSPVLELEKINRAFLKTSSITILNEFEIDRHLTSMFQEILQRNSNYIRGRSEAVLRNISVTSLCVARFRPLSGSRYQQLPAFLAAKKCIVNVQNTDERCFGYAVASALHDSDAARHYREAFFAPFFQQHGLDAITYPVEPREIPAIEQQIGIGVNVFSFFDDEGRGRYPLYMTQLPNPQTTVDLLYWNGHFACIKNFSRFLGDLTRHEHQLYICKRCFGHFARQDLLEKHRGYCSRDNFSMTIYTMPLPNSVAKFRSVRHELRIPFVVYADFECLTVPFDGAAQGRTTAYEKHEACSVGFKLVTGVAALKPLEIYTMFFGRDVVKQFLTRLLEL